MVLSRRWSAFLVLVGVWTWLIWPRFGLAIWKDDRSFADGRPTSFLWVHALLIGASLVIGTAVGVLGVRAWRAAPPRSRQAASTVSSRAASGGSRRAEETVAAGPAEPKD